MKIEEILTETTINSYPIKFSGDLDKRLNREADYFAEKTKEYYQKYFSKTENTPVFEKIDNNEKESQKWSARPDKNEENVSNGYAELKELSKLLNLRF